MEILNEIISLLRVVIIPLGVTFRVIFCLTKMIYDEDAQGTYKKKIKNTIVFGIIAELIFVILTLVQNYYEYSGSSGIPHGGGGRDF
jgi:hypothetical protein